MRHKPMTASRLMVLGLAFGVVASAGGGCARRQIVDQARALSREVRIYRQAQAERIERLNAEYRAAFAKNIDELVRLSDTELTQGRDVDAQLVADQITESDKGTFFGVLRGRLSGAVAAHRKAIASADEAIAIARANYVKSYKDAKLQLVKLDQLQSDLALLGQREDAGRVAGVVIQKVAENYRQIQEEQKQQGGGGGTSGEGG